MNRKILGVAVVLLLLSISMNLRYSLTGFVTGMQMNLSVAPSMRGVFSVLRYPNSIYQYSDMEIATEFYNIGSLMFYEQTDISIFYQNMTLIDIYYGGLYKLNTGDSK